MGAKDGTEGLAQEARYSGLPAQVPPSHFSHGFHRDMLLTCAAVILAAAVLRLDANGWVLLPFLDRHPIPSTCPSRVIFHVNCPTCGLTRSFIAMAHGQFARAFAFHRLGPPLFAFVFLQVPVRAYAILRRIPPGKLLPWRYWRLVPWVLLVALLGNWMYNLIAAAAG